MPDKESRLLASSHLRLVKNRQLHGSEWYHLLVCNEFPLNILVHARSIEMHRLS